MSAQFPVKKFQSLGGPATVEGEVVLESSVSWQVAVGGKIHILQKSEWREFGAFEDIFSMFGSPFGGR